ncbi:MAG TPA: hypothetical protein VFN57_18015, partial [Thermomicrobiaceae bacterium]|nr:hypothetical protein [Thermomicrobiaceae bacterium]
MSSRATPGRNGPAGSRRPLAMLIALAAVLALGGCGPLGGSSAGSAVISPDAARATVPAASPPTTSVTTAPVSSPSIAAAAASPTPAARAAVVAAANRFMRAFVAGDYAAQWAQLDPGEQAIWPSPTDRASFLTAKFGGSVAGFQLGTPRLAASWTSHEDTAYTVDHPWQVPVSVTFSDPATLQPAGVAV